MCCKNPLHMLLCLAVLIVAIVGLWNHDWTLIWIVIAVKIIAMFFHCKCENKKPQRKARAIKRRR